MVDLTGFCADRPKIAHSLIKGCVGSPSKSFEPIKMSEVSGEKGKGLPDKKDDSIKPPRKEPVEVRERERERERERVYNYRD